MADYKEMYLLLTRETERALRLLTNAQRRCEALYKETPDPVVTLLDGGAQAPPGDPGNPAAPCAASLISEGK